ncbi:MAG: hypothetical protein KatS3mg073_0620 [Meiothermus sp.]|uniref:Uncharacterized protein n=1 Tax=Meiothermus hypogaeus TaxID=884155 RepID=A0ABX9MHM9_9DEIN|nr:hypothetical protein Mhypo_03243 [Meiothermus hypogaeus]GIW36475.1 MAG: hypothetical protein KatS3mg073_0620 [Meiothermus sp.]
MKVLNILYCLLFDKNLIKLYCIETAKCKFHTSIQYIFPYVWINVIKFLYICHKYN